MRESGPVRFALGSTPAEQAAAAPYIGIARTQLGITKNLMNLGGLQQLTRVIPLQDGTVIRCQSVMGQDFIAITPPSVPVPQRAKSIAVAVQAAPEIAPPARKTRIKEIPNTEYGWFRLPDGPAKHGHQAVWDNTNKRMLVWGGYDRPGMDIPSMPEVLDDDTDIIWQARSGGRLRYASIQDFTFSTTKDGVLQDFYLGTYWFTEASGIYGPIFAGDAIGEGPRTASDLVAQLHIGDTWQDKADAVRYDMARGPFDSSLIDMLPSTALWKFEFTAGMPWSAAPNGATDGVWTRLADVSYNDWQAIVTAAGSVSISTDNAWAPDRGDALNHVTLRSGDFYRPDTSDYYPNYTVDDYWELYFGGTKDGTDTNASKQLWMYGPIVSVTTVEEEDPT